ncbi:MAG TPA: hypothetical protein VFP07_02055 [Buchnera sp. (in: enterobacteria)]|nr:hypothetical protein [Buchnera sp. (in: enterobacteria)]
MYLIDSHCHLDKINLKKTKMNLDEIIKNAVLNKVRLFLTISTSIKNFKKISNSIKKKMFFILVEFIHYMLKKIKMIF